LELPNYPTLESLLAVVRSPSPRNTPWLQRHPEFERRLLPELRRRIRVILRGAESDRGDGVIRQPIAR
jgi:hypothetical protein